MLYVCMLQLSIFRNNKEPVLFCYNNGMVDWLRELVGIQ